MSDSADEFDVFVPVPASERLTVDEFRRKAAMGEFSASKQFELLEGVVVPKARQTLKHETALENIQRCDRQDWRRAVGICGCSSR